MPAYRRLHVYALYYVALKSISRNISCTQFFAIDNSRVRRLRSLLRFPSHSNGFSWVLQASIFDCIPFKVLIYLNLFASGNFVVELLSSKSKVLKFFQQYSINTWFLENRQKTLFSYFRWETVKVCKFLEEELKDTTFFGSVLWILVWIKQWDTTIFCEETTFVNVEKEFNHFIWWLLNARNEPYSLELVEFLFPKNIETFR